MKTCLTVSQMLQIADFISDIPNTDKGSSTELADWLEVDHINYIKNGDDMKFMVTDSGTSMEFTALALLKHIGNWKAAIAYAMTQEYYEYAYHINPCCWVRCNILSALLGFDSGCTPDPEDFTESEYGVFFGGRRNIKIVTKDKEIEYDSIAQFLEWAIQ